MQGKSIGEMKVGDKASVTRAFTEQDVADYARVSGDHNPAHMDEEYAKTTMFKTRIVHGMLVGSLFSALLGTELPGVGSIYTGLRHSQGAHHRKEPRDFGMPGCQPPGRARHHGRSHHHAP